MKSSIRKVSYFGPPRRRVAIALAIASLLGGLSISQAFADNHDRGGRRDNHGQRASHDYRGNYGQFRPDYRRPYNYERPVYVPPPVYYEPRQSPGISLFLPLDLRR